MKNITQITAVETATAIWEYDPTLPDNRVLGWTASQVEEVESFDFQELLDDDTDLVEWEKEFGQNW